MPITPSKVDPKKDDILQKINEKRLKNTSLIPPDSRKVYNKEYLRPMPVELGVKNEESQESSTGQPKISSRRRSQQARQSEMRMATPNSTLMHSSQQSSSMQSQQYIQGRIRIEDNYITLKQFGGAPAMERMSEHEVLEFDAI